MNLSILNHSKTFKKFLFSTFLFISLLISGCSSEDDGGGDSGGDGTAQVGIFVDSEVGGLNYWTETQSGTTNANGEFKYREGETVTFAVGDVEIGSGEASSVMSPVSIASTANASVGSPEVMNIAAFLQTLDSDNDPSNGIMIEASVAEAIPVTQIDFNQSITELLGSIVVAVNEATGSNLVPVYPATAAEHLAESLGETFEAEDLTFEYFIPVLETYNSFPRTVLNWVHETDNNGKLVKSYMYERRPHRLIHEITYHTWNENDQPTSFDRVFFRNGVVSQTTRVKTKYNEDHQVSEYAYYAPASAPVPSNTNKFVAFDEQNRVTEMHYYDHNSTFVFRDVIVLNDAGNKLMETRYSTKTGDSEADMLYQLQYAYNEAGELKDRFGFDATGEFDHDYYYRADHTLERMERTLIREDGTVREDVYYYDENEFRERAVITVGDYKSDYVSFYENGDPHVVETYYKDFLYEIITYAEDGSSVWKTISQDDNSYILEYKDPEGNIYKTEFYDAEGNLLSSQ